MTLMNLKEYHTNTGDFYSTKPNLAVAFHPGWCFEWTADKDARNSPRWMPTIQHLGKATHPTLFTSMNEYEMNEETRTLGFMGYSLVRKGIANKWKSMSPQPEALRKGVLYRNYYSYILGGCGP